MNDFGTTLTTLFDEVAGTIEPRLNFEAVLHGEIHDPVSVVTPHRPTWHTLGYAAASVALVAGAVVSVDHVLGRGDSVATREGEAAASFDPAWYGINPAARLGRSSRPSTNEPERRPLVVPVAPEPTTTAPTTTVAAPPTTVPVVAEAQPPDDTARPTPVAPPSAAKLGWSSTTSDPMKQALYGTAAPNEKVVVTSPFGEVSTRADRRGEWSVVLLLTGVPWGTAVPITVTLTTSGATYMFEIVRPPEPTTTTSTTTTTLPPPPPTTVKPAEQPAPTPTEPRPEPTQPAAVAFTSNLGFADLAASPMKQVFSGTGTPGSVVRAESAYGSAETSVGSKGKWELKLKMFDVPVGTAVGVRVSNNASDAVFEYTVVKQPPPAPPEIEFSADAAFTECDSPVPFNEYWGKSTAGATITISSPYGGGQTTSNEDGKWEARIEFPGAPIGEPFTVTITRSKSSAAYNFSLVSTRTV
jgi:hypothetical protein